MNVACGVLLALYLGSSAVLGLVRDARCCPIHPDVRRPWQRSPR